MRDDFLAIQRLMNDFVTQCKALNQCMLDDQSYFAGNDRVSLEKSDLKKSTLQADLNMTISQLINHPALTAPYSDLFVRLSYFAGTLNDTEQGVLLDVIQQMRVEYASAIRLVAMNRQVVNTNLGYIKDFISQVTETSPSMDSATYDHAGVLG